MKVWKRDVWQVAGDGAASPCRLSAFRFSTFRFSAFTLLEVMIACGIFFMATFAILGLVSNTLRNARSLQRGEVDAGMAAAQVYQTLRTNRDEQGYLSGDFGDTYPEYSWDAQWDLWKSNGLLVADIVVNRRGARDPVDKLTIWIYSPNAKPKMGTASFR